MYVAREGGVEVMRIPSLEEAFRKGAFTSFIKEVRGYDGRDFCLGVTANGGPYLTSWDIIS